MHGPFIKDAVTLQVLHESVAFDSSTTKVLHRHDRDFLFEGKKQQNKTTKKRNVGCTPVQNFVVSSRQRSARA
jgi:hypothetical protein